MSIPLDKLYHYIESVAERIRGDRVLIYRFYPHGSKKINDLSHLGGELTDIEIYLCPKIYCNDQEPLNYNLYSDYVGELQDGLKITLEQKGIEFPSFNFRGFHCSIWDWALLLHSEQRSEQITKYQNTKFIPVYYWNHAIIAQDWFRFAQHVTQKKQTTKTFLIYNRAWSGTREYRLCFAELLVKLNLQNFCKTSINPIEPELGIHYDTHEFKNPAWQPRTILENYFPINTTQSHYSADFDLPDYETTDIEIVLETLFDDGRLHLTEKSLRPIACGQPFILAGTHGSLEYLRNYGFKTFGDIWDESYDLVVDPKERLCAITDLMKNISCWSPLTKENKLTKAQNIANFNKKHFFSKKFTTQIFKELERNLQNGLKEIEDINTASHYLHCRKIFLSDPDLLKFSIFNKNRQLSDLLFETAQKYYQRTIKPLQD
jgi:hypothetical protein